jgi:hypothetical protein
MGKSIIAIRILFIRLDYSSFTFYIQKFGLAFHPC